jgi:hypothetical protein
MTSLQDYVLVGVPRDVLQFANCLKVENALRGPSLVTPGGFRQVRATVAWGRVGWAALKMSSGCGTLKRPFVRGRSGSQPGAARLHRSIKVSQQRSEHTLRVAWSCTRQRDCTTLSASCRWA